ncbi:hypothetical protein Tco_0889652 [Tanacetum coccineum]
MTATSTRGPPHHPPPTPTPPPRPIASSKPSSRVPQKELGLLFHLQHSYAEEIEHPDCYLMYPMKMEILLEQHRNKLCSIPLREIISELPLSIAIIHVLPTLEPGDFLIMRNEEFNTIPEKESDEVIKSSVENFVPIPSEFEDTSKCDSEFILPPCDDFSPINVYKEKFVNFSNPLFDSNDDFTL